MYKRIEGCFFGQLVGDALGSRYEFTSSSDVKKLLKSDTKNNFIPILGGGPFSVKPGQITDDSELALCLTRALIENKKYLNEKIAQKYIKWFQSNPVDIGISTKKAFLKTLSYDDIVKNSKKYNKNSLSNGCLMRISPLAIYGLKISSKELEKCAKDNCIMTNPNEITVNATIVFVVTLKELMKTGNKDKAYQKALKKAKNDVKKVIEDAKIRPYSIGLKPDGKEQGFYKIALQNAFYHLLNGKDFYTSMIETIALGGDTDTNGCITGTLLGAYYGIEGIPEQWIKTVINVKTSRYNKFPDAKTSDAFELVKKLINKKIDFS